MKLYGAWVAQDEADVIRDTLNYLRKLNVFEKIFFLDLGSKDATFEIVQEFPDLIADPQRLAVPFSGKLKPDLMNQHRELYQPGDWLAIIDSDEFFAEDPREIIRFAEQEQAVAIETWQAQFYFTDQDLENWDHEDLRRPIYERRLHYLIHWSEIRFYKFLPPRGQDQYCFDLGGKVCSRKLLNRHYPYRSPDQIKRKVRRGVENYRTGRFGRSYQGTSERWLDYVIDQRLLHPFHGEFQFGVPAGVNWNRYYNFWTSDPNERVHVIYNNMYINWLIQHGFLPPWSVPDLCRKAFGRAFEKSRTLFTHKQPID